MINLRNSPFLWLSLTLVAALALAEHIRPSAWPRVQPALLLLMIPAGLLALRKYTGGFYLASTFGLTLLVFSAGMLNYHQFSLSHFPDSPMDAPRRMDGWVVVTQVLKNKPGLVRMQCRVRKLESSVDSVQVFFTDPNLLLQIRGDSNHLYLPGDELRVSGWVYPIAGPLNPFAFDARTYYRTLCIRHQMSVMDAPEEIKPPEHFSLLRLTAQWQSTLSALVRQHTAPASAQVINALVWGDRSDMAEDVLDAFADSGAMHVLSVSGMHVAMIYSILFLLLGAPGDGVLWKRMIRLVLYATAISLYVCLTGACPAVVRAGWMILLFLLGKSMGWNTQVWNLIGFSAFLMLWMNPLLYHQVGFQLSFLAMAGILLYAKPILRMAAFRSKWLHWLWEVTAVSLAAQVFILPIILRQFHQFPLTFILSSIVAIPAGYVVIFGALLNSLLSCIGVDLLWPVLDCSCAWFVQTMKWMAALNPVMNYSLPSLGHALLIWMSVIFSVAWLYRWKTGKVIGYILGLAVATTLLAHRINQWTSGEFILYHSYKGLLMDISSGGRIYTVADSALTTSQVEYAARGYRCYRDAIAIVPLHPEQTFLSESWQYDRHQLRTASGTCMLYNDQDYKDTVGSPTHLIILRCRDPIRLCTWMEDAPHALFVLTASCPRDEQRKVKRLARQMDIRLYDINTEGYLKMSL